MIYFATVRQVGKVKIGHSDGIDHRLISLKNHNPVPPIVEAMTRGGPLVERWFHLRHRESHSHGEWFNLTPAVEADIRQIIEARKVAGQVYEPTTLTWKMYHVGLIVELCGIAGMDLEQFAAATGINRHTLKTWSRYGLHTSRVADLYLAMERIGHPITLQKLVRMYAQQRERFPKARQPIQRVAA